MENRTIRLGGLGNKSVPLPGKILARATLRKKSKTELILMLESSQENHMRTFSLLQDLVIEYDKLDRKENKLREDRDLQKKSDGETIQIYQNTVVAYIKARNAAMMVALFCFIFGCLTLIAQLYNLFKCGL